MKSFWLFVATCVLLVAAVFVVPASAGPYLQDDDDGIPLEDEYSENALDRFLQSAQNLNVLQMKRDEKPESSEKTRACVRRGGNCDHRPTDCCYNSSCRCNLWGSNCRCQRMGLFQKWG